MVSRVAHHVDRPELTQDLGDGPLGRPEARRDALLRGFRPSDIALFGPSETSEMEDDAERQSNPFGLGAI